ncbi:MAG: SCO family protein [Chloroflexota bacterium]|nr:SCO family protein [Chloroflexota bacterium]
MRPRLLVLVRALVLAVGVACQPRSALPVLWQGPDFALTDQTGRPFASSELAGKVVVANFVFTSCTDVCPLLTGTMARVRDELRSARLLGDKAMLVSFSVDPEHDTPAALADYGAHFGADPAEWKFLTGERRQIDDLLTLGYKVGAPPRVPKPGAAPEIVHTNRFVLVDPRGQVRALLHGDELDVPQLVEEVRRLAS